MTIDNARPADTSGHTHAEDDGEQPGTRGELLWVDPRSLIIEENVRLNEDLDPEFLDSVAEHGVLQAISVRRRASDGALVVRLGMRRTIAAVRAGRWLHAVVEDEPAPETGSDPDEQVRRIVDQLSENRHRRANTDPDEVTAHQLLIGFGLSAEQIAATTHTDPERVRRTTSIGRSTAAMRAMRNRDLDLVQLAAIAEFDGDDDAVAELEHTARTAPAQFDHLVERLRQRRERADAYRARVAELTDAGTTVLDPSDHPGASPLHLLRASAEDAPGKALSEDEHAECHGHAVQVQVYMRGGGGGVAVEQTPWCLEPDTYGHVLKWAPSPSTEAGPDGSTGEAVDLDADTSTPSAEPETGADDDLGADDDADRDDADDADDVDAARAEAEAAALRRREDERRAAEERAAEQERARRREQAERAYQVALCRNRTAEAEAAATVRRAWLRNQLLTRKTAPKDATRYIARVLATGLPFLRLDDVAWAGHPIACELLGVEAPQDAEFLEMSVSQGLVDTVHSANAGRATVLTLALLLGAQEAAIPSQAWESPDPHTAEYLRQLEEWKYTLSPIEELMVEPDPSVRIDGDPDPLPDHDAEPVPDTDGAEDVDTGRPADAATGIDDVTAHPEPDTEEPDTEDGRRDVAA